MRIPSVPQGWEVFIPSILSPILRLQHRQWWHSNGRREDGCHSDLASPSTIKKLQRFLGFSNFYWRFIQNYSTITSPLTSLLRNKPKSLSWTPAAKEAFETLKDAFTHAPILVHPDPHKPFIVEVDASTTGVGAILSQQQGTPIQLHPHAFFSRKLSPAERNYDIGNRELLAIKLALEEWRHWLENMHSQHPFTVLTDHKNLQHLRGAKRLNPRNALWALFFTRFTYTISYRPGPKNTKADALSHLHTQEETEEELEPIIPEKLPHFLQCFQGNSARLSTRGTVCHPNSAHSPTTPSCCWKTSTSGQTWPGMSEGSSKAVRTAPFQKALATYQQASSSCCPFPTGHGHTWG